MESATSGAVVFFTAVLVVSCGGGGDSVSSMVMTYDFPTPQVNSQRLYDRTIIDNSNDTIAETLSDIVTTVNADGSYVVFEDDPDNNSVTVNGTTYSVTTATVDLNKSGQETTYSYTAENGNVIVWTYTPHGAGPDFPLTVGQTWTLDYMLVCGTNLPVAYTQTGTVVDVESVTVPAGAYSALKLQSTIMWTDQSGTTRTQTITNWRDVNTMFSVKEVVEIAYSGLIPTNGYPVSTQTILQSES